MATVGIPRGNHTHDFDSNGVVHLLGTAFGKLDECSLAEASSRCRVTASENNKESTPPLSDSLHPFFTPNLEQQQLPTMFNNNIVFILSKEPRRVFLNSGIGSWFCLDLGPRVSVVPTAITLRRSSSQRRALRNFTVEGSADGEMTTRPSRGPSPPQRRSGRRAHTHARRENTRNEPTEALREPTDSSALPRQAGMRLLLCSCTCRELKSTVVRVDMVWKRKAVAT
mmetsp:Transcript_61553/g.144792  ORF Transcript_61553/g.144792 Transcript_61553/m.144792 type:complete len:226 (+) Transcript_61553:292-969(+)